MVLMANIGYTQVLYCFYCGIHIWKGQRRGHLNGEK